MRLGIFGGTFDPVHYGHLILAECSREQANLDAVWFMPAAEPPHKLDRPVSAAQHRVTMLELAVGGHAAMDVSDVELVREGPSYTVDTLAELAAEDAARELFLLMGSDSLADLRNWREPGRICDLATPVVAVRAGAAAVDVSPLEDIASAEQLEAIRRHVVEMPAVGISSTDLRRRAAEGRSLRFQTPRAVEKYIETNGLYASV